MSKVYLTAASEEGKRRREEERSCETRPGLKRAESAFDKLTGNACGETRFACVLVHTPITRYVSRCVEPTVERSAYGTGVRFLATAYGIWLLRTVLATAYGVFGYCVRFLATVLRGVKGTDNSVRNVGVPLAHTPRLRSCSKCVKSQSVLTSLKSSASAYASARHI